MLCTLLEAEPEQRALEKKHYESDPEKPEYFQVSTNIEPTYRECSLVRENVPADPDSVVYREPTSTRSVATPAPAPPSSAIITPPGVMAPEPPPEVYIAQIPGPTEEIIFYDTGIIELADSELNARLQPTLARGIPAAIIIDAHTDTVGSEEANQALALARANQIRDWYVARGIEPYLIKVTAHGETNLPVETTDNVDEPKNRRVAVRLLYGEQ